MSPKMFRTPTDCFTSLVRGVGIAVVVEPSLHVCIDGVTYVPLGEGAESFALVLAWRHSNSSTALEIAREMLPLP